ncbi:MAG: TerC family protein [Thermoleophilia bacterium]
MAVDPWVWLALVAFIGALLALDLLVFHRDAHEVTLREAAVFSALWVAVAVGFGGVLWAWQGGTAAGEYFAGYVVEKSLSVDNVFVFALVFSYFAVPAVLQYRVLFWGVVLAIVLRGAFIALGAALLASVGWIVYVFGAFLVLTGVRIARHAHQEIHPERNPVLRLLRRVVPLTDDYRGSRFLVREGGRRLATPLLAAFVMVATFDLVFAVDSIPAIFAITRDTFIVFAANAFALLGLRALFFLLAGTMRRIPSLNVGLGLILVFVGGKMIASDHYKVPIYVSLPVILGVLGAVALVAWLRGRRAPGGEAPA